MPRGMPSPPLPSPTTHPPPQPQASPSRPPWVADAYGLPLHMLMPPPMLATVPDQPVDLAAEADVLSEIAARHYDAITAMSISPERQPPPPPPWTAGSPPPMPSPFASSIAARELASPMPAYVDISACRASPASMASSPLVRGKTLAPPPGYFDGPGSPQVPKLPGSAYATAPPCSPEAPAPPARASPEWRLLRAALNLEPLADEKEQAGAEAGACLLALVKFGAEDSWPLGKTERGHPSTSEPWSVPDSEGVLEARRHTDGRLYVRLDGEWIEASAKYYCCYCQAWGNETRPHLASARHKRNKEQGHAYGARESDRWRGTRVSCGRSGFDRSGRLGSWDEEEWSGSTDHPPRSWKPASQARKPGEKLHQARSWRPVHG